MIRDEWRITSAAIEREMERIAGLLQKSIHFQSRTSAAHPVRHRHEVKETAPAIPELMPELIGRKR